MPYNPVAWAYKQVVTSAKLQQMVDNIVAHDHRIDASQGAPWATAWTPIPGLTRSINWTIQVARYKRILGTGSNLVLLDFSLTRLNSNLAFGSSGNVTDTPVLTGMPAGLRPASANRFLRGQRGTVVTFGAYLSPSGVLGIGNGQTNSSIAEGSSITIGDLVWLD